MLRTISSLLLPALLAPAQPAADFDFTAAIGEIRDISQATTKALIAQAEAYLSKRPALASEADVKARAALVRQQILKNIGGLPERTPLNARVVGTIDRGAYRIEKVIFESQPRFYVTANLYIPNRGSGPFPAILFPLGHESGAKAHEAWQRVLGSFAKKGFVALTWDPLGQGERSQFYDPDLHASKLTASTREHSMLGLQCLLAGDNIARYTIHDGIRALDYLVSRKEVDPNRIGVTGNSGGGTHTAYLAAVDDRFRAAAPSCYITSWKSLITLLGPQDAEQNLPPWLNLGFDFPDFLYAFSLKPYLVLSAIRDFFPIGGARASFSEAQAVYQKAGVGERIAMFEADDGHGYTKPRRLAAYAWMSRWLANREDDGTEPDIELATEAELWCTKTGQVSTSLGGETVFSLNQHRVSQFRHASTSPEQLIQAARSLTGYEAPKVTPAITSYGFLTRHGYKAEKLTYESEPGVLVPAVLAVPDNPRTGAEPVIYADCAGKSAAVGSIEAFIREGAVVLAPDVRSCGELSSKEPRGPDPWFGDVRNASAAMLLGKTMVGLRALDLTAGIEVLKSRGYLPSGRVRAVGAGAASLPVLYAAGFDDRIASLELQDLLTSYQSVVDSRLHRRVWEQAVPGVLRRFDIPDLLKAVAPRPVRVHSRVDAMGEAVPAPAE